VNLTTTLRRQVIKECPYKDETDVGELTIVIPGEAPELHNLADAVNTLSRGPVSHEDFTLGVADMLPPGSKVTTTWRTGPWDVEVTADAAVSG
jgi:hypothetical protein